MSVQLFLLCALTALTVVVHSFVADSSLFDLGFCFFVLFFVCFLLLFFLHLMGAGRPPFGFLRWCQLFSFFHLMSTVCLPDQGSPFSFAISFCGLVFLSFGISCLLA